MTLEEMMMSCPAVQFRFHSDMPEDATFNYPYGNRVPKRIRLARPVAPFMDDGPFMMKLLQGASGEARGHDSGETFWAYTNSYGAVCLIRDDGSKLGVKPGEFDVVEWLEVTP